MSDPEECAVDWSERQGEQNGNDENKERLRMKKRLGNTLGWMQWGNPAPE
jgi:hypothetical protein